MTDAANPAATATCCTSKGCCTSSACCPCEARLQKLERTVRRIRLWLLVSLGAFLLLLGIAIGSGSARRDMEGRRPGERPSMPSGPGPVQPGPMAQPGPMMQPGPSMQPGPMGGRDRRGARGPDGPGR